MYVSIGQVISELTYLLEVLHSNRPYLRPEECALSLKDAGDSYIFSFQMRQLFYGIVDGCATREEAIQVIKNQLKMNKGE